MSDPRVLVFPIIYPLGYIILIIFPCQYEVKAPVPSACFRNICKQMAKMHEAIFDLLPEEQTQVSSNS